MEGFRNDVKVSASIKSKLVDKRTNRALIPIGQREPRGSACERAKNSKCRETLRRSERTPLGNEQQTSRCSALLLRPSTRLAASDSTRGDEGTCK
eukprot:300492-Pleurochrysis_carterae.AAC.3